jgi:hypothetical protein
VSEITRPWRPVSTWQAISVPSVRVERILLALAALFVMTGLILLALVARLTWSLGLASFVTWALSFVAAHVLLNHLLPSRDPLLLPVTALLCGWGLIEIARLAPPFLVRQRWASHLAGALLAVAAAPRDLRWLPLPLYGFSPAAAAGRDAGVRRQSIRRASRTTVAASRPLYLQPSEILKLLFIAISRPTWREA